MKTQTDIGLDETEDIDIHANDFTMVESTRQHQQQLILNNKGDFKQNPTICVGAFDYLDDENYQELIRAVCIEFTKDGMNVASVNLGSNGVISSNANY